MTDRPTALTRRRTILFGGALTTVLGGFYLQKGIRKMKPNITTMHEELAMLMDIGLRRVKLKNAPLIISNATFSENLEALFCENTQFIECDFTGDIRINISNFTEVRFVNCNIHESSINGGRWQNVLFDGCNGIGEFGIAGGEGSSNVVFHKCTLAGSPPHEDRHREDGYGVAGTFGSASFVDCDISYMNLIGPSGLSIKDSRLNQVDATTQRKNGYLTLDNVDIKEYLDLTAGIFSSIRMTKVRFEYLDMTNVKTDTLTIESSQGHFFGKALTAKHVEITKCTFGANGDPTDVSERENSGFSIIYAKIDSLSIDDVKFIGTNGSLFLGGAINIMYKKDQPKYGGPIDYTTYGKISINNTSLKGAFFSYLKSKEMKIDRCNIGNADFVHCQIGNMEITGSEFSGKTDFSGAVIDRLRERDNIRSQDAKIFPDTRKQITS